jgi:delta-aminolevulinic acid dehydratase/porphobilinogen synthase
MIRARGVATASHTAVRHVVRYYHCTKRLSLNRIFVERSEIVSAEDVEKMQTVCLQSPDDRFQHINNILKIGVGDVIKMGVIDAGITDRATVIDKTLITM